MRVLTIAIAAAFLALPAAAPAPGLRERGSLCQGGHRRLLRSQEEEGQTAEGESGVYACGPDEVSPLRFS